MKGRIVADGPAREIVQHYGKKDLEDFSSRLARFRAPGAVVSWGGSGRSISGSCFLMRRKLRAPLQICSTGPLLDLFSSVSSRCPEDGEGRAVLAGGVAGGQ